VKLLLDTHAFLWFLFGNPRLPRRAVEAIETTAEVVLSAAAGYEIAFKHARGRLPEAGTVAADIGGIAAARGIGLLPITLAHAEAAGRLPLHHRDPFDRLLAAQALLEGLTLVSADPQFDAYGVPRLW
jgi:PIN domain nuclease of toxin-antitoxin system